MKSNLLQRTVTGVLFVAVLVGCILWNALSFAVLFALIAALSVEEFTRLINDSGRASLHRELSALSAACLFFAFWGLTISSASITCGATILDMRLFIPYLLLQLYQLIRELYLKRENPIANWAYTMLGQLYIALPFALLNLLAFHTSADGAVGYNPILPLSIFVFIWLNDSGAYCVGSLMGKHRLFERISPKKSWEGSIGGGLLALGASLFFAHYYPFLTWGGWMGLSLTVVVFGTWGDLVESLLKRQLGIKDSGHILPGHGGMLDRFDSALLAIPAAVIYLYVLTLFG
jgi:phosphatidate cytidylyltransferase